MRKNVLVLVPSLNTGGLEKMALHLCRGLRRDGEWTPYVFSFDGATGSLAPEFEKIGVEVRFFEKGPGFNTEVARKIVELAREFHTPVIHSHDIGAIVYGAIAKLRTLGRLKLVHTQHTFLHLSQVPKYRYYERVLPYFADRVCAVSENLRNTYASLGVGSGRITVVPNGIEFPSATFATRNERLRARVALLELPEAAPHRERLQAEQGAQWILFLARINKAKGQHTLVRMWGEMSPEARKKSLLIFVGQESEPGYWAEVTRQIQQVGDADRILRFDYTTRAPLWLRAANIYATASEFEGMPLGPLEAVGEGLPVLASDIPGHAMFRDYGAFFPLQDSAPGARVLEQWISRIAQDEDAFYRQQWQAGETYRNRYGLDAMAAEYCRIYDSVWPG